MSKRRSSGGRSVKSRFATGPRTAAGKKRSRENAHRHGLAVPVCSDPLVFPQVTKVAKQIAGPVASEAVKQIARQIAEAQLHVIRCRQARCRAVETATNQNEGPLEDALSDAALREYLLKHWWNWKDKGRPAALSLCSEKQEMVIDRHRQRIRKQRDRMHISNLTVIDRYERRALSRRNRAMEDLDCQRILEAAKAK